MKPCKNSWKKAQQPQKHNTDTTHVTHQVCRPVRSPDNVRNIVHHFDMQREELVLIWVLHPWRKLVNLQFRPHNHSLLRDEHIHETWLVLNLVNIDVQVSKLGPLSSKLLWDHLWLILNWSIAVLLMVECLFVHNYLQLRLTDIILR